MEGKTVFVITRAAVLIGFNRRRLLLLTGYTLLAISLIGSSFSSVVRAQSSCNQPAQDGCPIQFGGRIDGKMASGDDVHTWRLSVPARGQIAIELTVSGAYRGGDVDLDLYVRDMAGSEVGSSQNEGRAFDTINALVSPGEYLVYVEINPSRNRGFTNVPYELRAYASPDIWTALPRSTGDGRVVASHLSSLLSAVRVQFSSDGQILATSAYDGSVRLWQVSDGSLVHTFQDPEFGEPGRVFFRLAVSPDLKLVAITSRPPGRSGFDTVAKLWNITDGSFIAQLDQLDVEALVFSPDSRMLATGSGRMPIRLWQTSDGSLLDTFPGRGRPTLFSSDGQILVVAAQPDPVFWRVQDRTQLQTLSGQSVIQAISPDSQLVARVINDGSFRLVRTSNLELVGILEGRRVINATFAPDGQTVALACADSVLLWRIADRAIVRTIPQTDQAAQVAFSPDGQLLAVGLRDGTARLWSVP